MKFIPFTFIMIFAFINSLCIVAQESEIRKTKLVACPCLLDTSGVNSEYIFTEYRIVNRLHELRNIIRQTCSTKAGDTLVQLFLDYDMQKDTLIIFKNCFEWNGSIYSKDSSLYARINPYIPYDCWLKIHKYFE